jgi:hypothetical protein
MKLEITDMNFLNNEDWIFKLVDNVGNIYHVMNDKFYKANDLRNPISKHEFDYYDIGTVINAAVIMVDGKILLQKFEKE